MSKEAEQLPGEAEKRVLVSMGGAGAGSIFLFAISQQCQAGQQLRLRRHLGHSHILQF